VAEADFGGYEGGTMLDCACKFTIDSDEPLDFLATIIGSALRDALCVQALDLAETGLTVIVGPRPAKAHIFNLKEEAA
jgi:hypothetical protein